MNMPAGHAHMCARGSESVGAQARALSLSLSHTRAIATPSPLAGTAL
jgi:hypothetical protein